MIYDVWLMHLWTQTLMLECLPVMSNSDGHSILKLLLKWKTLCFQRSFQKRDILIGTNNFYIILLTRLMIEKDSFGFDYLIKRCKTNLLSNFIFQWLISKTSLLSIFDFSVMNLILGLSQNCSFRLFLKKICNHSLILHVLLH